LLSVLPLALPLALPRSRAALADDLGPEQVHEQLPSSHRFDPRVDDTREVEIGAASVGELRPASPAMLQAVVAYALEDARRSVAADAATDRGHRFGSIRHDALLSGSPFGSRALQFAFHPELLCALH
jgi:hypothetical protein